MVAGFSNESNELTAAQLKHCVMRNFGGYEPKRFDPLPIFETSYSNLPAREIGSPPTDAIGIIEACVSGDYRSFSG